jgi:hypothetical protein
MADLKTFWDNASGAAKLRRGSDDGPSSSGSDDSSSSGSGSDDTSTSSDDDIVIIEGVPVKLRGDGSIDDSQPSGLESTGSGLKLRGDGSIDDSQPGILRILGTRRDDSLFGTGLTKEFLRGRRGKDDFVLGNRTSSFYLKTRKDSRDTSFAVVEDFRREDEIVLHGARSEYRFGMVRRGGETGLGIFHKGGKGADLVALLADRNQIAASQLNFIG